MIPFLQVVLLALRQISQNRQQLGGKEKVKEKKATPNLDKEDAWTDSVEQPEEKISKPNQTKPNLNKEEDWTESVEQPEEKISSLAILIQVPHFSYILHIVQFH